MSHLDGLHHIIKETNEAIISHMGKDCYSVTKLKSDPKDDECEQDANRVVFYSELHEVVASCEINPLGDVEIPSIFLYIKNVPREQWLDERSKRIS